LVLQYLSARQVRFGDGATMILAIETSDILCSVAFWEKGRTLLEYNLELPMQHAALVGELVNEGLKFLSSDDRSQKYNIDDIHLVAVSIGPGSFTGLRIGLSYAQGLCYGKNIPITGVSNHQALARQRAAKSSALFTLIEARRDEVYLAEHEIISEEYTVIKDHQIIQKNAVSNRIPGGAQVICKKDLKLDENIVNELLKKNICLMNKANFSASLLADLGNEKYRSSGADDLANLEPMYIRPFAGVL
jgi:tRNA threonylcarbamoyladenosine biosynthesis protein TsaB